jgi:hypothetical protein
MQVAAGKSLKVSLFRRRRKVRAYVLWALVGSMSLLACSLSAGAANGPPAWGARIVDRGSYSGLTSSRGSLYAVRFAASGPLLRGTQVVRINATSGKIVAVSAVVPGVDAPVFAGKTLWLSGVTHYSRNAEHEGPSVLYELNPLTLAKERELRTNLPGQISLLGTPEGTLWEMSRGVNSCTLRRVDPSSGLVISTNRVSFVKGPCGGGEFDAAGKDLYVAINTPTGENAAMYKLNGQSGALIAHSKIPNIAMFTSMAATSKNLWIAGGDPGSDGFLLHLSTSPLKVVAESSFLKGDGEGEENLGPRGYELPTFGQFPIVDLSSNMIWVASDGGVACFLPTSKKALSYVDQRVAPIITSSIVAVGHSTWAISNFGSLGNGIVRLAPSSPCVR